MNQPRWRFLTNHAHVLLAVAADPDARVEDIADAVGITKRAVLGILADLDDAGYLVREHVGRRTHYRLSRHRPFRHPRLAHHEVDELLAVLVDVHRDHEGEATAGGRAPS